MPLHHPQKFILVNSVLVKRGGKRYSVGLCLRQKSQLGQLNKNLPRYVIAWQFHDENETYFCCKELSFPRGPTRGILYHAPAAPWWVICHLLKTYKCQMYVKCPGEWVGWNWQSFYRTINLMPVVILVWVACVHLSFFLFTFTFSSVTLILSVKCVFELSGLSGWSLSPARFSEHVLPLPPECLSLAGFIHLGQPVFDKTRLTALLM